MSYPHFRIGRVHDRVALIAHGKGKRRKSDRDSLSPLTGVRFQQTLGV